MITISCCFTGHRKLTDVSQIKARLKDTIQILIQAGVTQFLSGGAIGFDTLAACSVLQLKEQYPFIRLNFILPCQDQDRYWTENDRLVYQSILRQADTVQYLSQSYDAGCMHRRNRCLVDRSDICVCYLTQTSGGTKYTVDYARKKESRL